LELTDPHIAPIIAAMREKFLKYWEQVPKVTIIANVLHPSYKLYYAVKMLFKFKTHLDLLPRGTEEPEVRALIEDMFSHYNNRRNTAQSIASSSTYTRYIF
jgi:hypothetical protein